MHPKSTATRGLVLERLPSGELAWLQPEPRSVAGVDDPDPRYVLTDRGRRALAMERLFGPWPTVAEA